MAGTVAGGKLAAQKNKEKYGEDFYKNIGAKGGKMSTPRGGFGAVCVREDCPVSEEHLYGMCFGAKGGKISKRPPRV